MVYQQTIGLLTLQSFYADPDPDPDGTGRGCRKLAIKKTVCESGSGWIRNFFLDPELFVSNPNPCNNNTLTQINDQNFTSLLLELNRKYTGMFI